MTEVKFIAKNEETWKTLEAFNHHLAKSRRGVKGLAVDEVREFSRLFRLASHHLAYAKTHFPTGNALPYLNRIVGVAHNFFYVREKGGFGQVWEYFAYTFPQAVRDTWRFWAVAAAFFALGVVFAGFYVSSDPANLQTIMPGWIGDGTLEGETPDWGDGGVAWDYAYMTAVIGTNNVRVAFMTFAFGILGGIGTIFILVYNGLIVGALMGFFHQSGADMLIAYSLILPHGVLELMAIFLCGGGGLMIGKGLLIPGDLTRRHALIASAKQAAVLMPGVVAMLVIAAVIEGFFTPLGINPWLKLTFAALTGIGFIVYSMRIHKDA
ncbi:MAG: stage II sporulation protein M [Defluviitaleaceae bacterium]|nr:stage II sporulation protein M [Defluviitaleaceae bacterium]